MISQLHVLRWEEPSALGRTCGSSAFARLAVCGRTFCFGEKLYQHTLNMQITNLSTLSMQDLPELDIESTVLNRLAVLEVLCKNQAQTIDALQRENNRLHSCLTASTSYDAVRSGNLQQETLST